MCGTLETYICKGTTIDYFIAVMIVLIVIIKKQNYIELKNLMDFYNIAATLLNDWLTN